MWSPSARRWRTTTSADREFPAVSLLLFSKSPSTKHLSRITALPMLFNVNEPLVFGLPIVFNPYLFLPFLLAPILFTLTSALSMTLGLVPIATESVKWTMPVIFSGYWATGCLAGSLLQVVNMILGVLLYRPFVMAYDKEKSHSAVTSMRELVSQLEISEKNNAIYMFTERRDAIGTVAKNLVVDMRRALKQRELKLFYQPQFDYQHRPAGAEALLRWPHPAYGMVSPPLIIHLAEEAGMLEELETYIIRQAAADMAVIRRRFSAPFSMCVNITVNTMFSPSFEPLLQELVGHGLEADSLCFEITEQRALSLTQDAEDTFARIHAMGFRIAIDDFSMGHTSLNYLQKNQFDLVKLDGSLVREIETNSRKRDIISSILYLSESLGFSVVAEYVETQEQKEILNSIGCHLYQGYLFSPAVPISEFLRFAEGAG